MTRILAVALMVLTVFSASADELKVAVAANFAHTLSKVAERFEAETGHRVRISSGATGALYTQIQHGAPFDLFLAADSHRPQLLEQEQKILPGSRVTYAIGQLAYWQRSGEPSEQSLAQWQAKLAIANPRLAPYGAAARDVLGRLGLVPKLKGKLVTGSNILQTYQYVDSGNVQAGLVALSQLRSAEVDPHHYWVVPDHYHAPLEQQAVVLRRSTNPQLAQQLLDYLNRQQRLLTDAGYQVSAHVAQR
ncbi:molybdate ABC transporter substrate-binding protein [Ferrimonas sediminicola]|uniref:Molybdate ABC transporter substrate-binding protein n=1 Tax=Ferrimonas sediminicola TaxID=2569538 RepID=A0A4U1BIB6_9GAMM|nr:molybdate ABC transporter substrate-binding protein [Ferrimonas sediminicola]TKB51063.1 molybdate ABC transporter substrate-binding protein [Ferrimonas sediminicola]